MAFALPLAVSASTPHRRRGWAMQAARCCATSAEAAVGAALRVAYTEHHAVPSSAGCAHDLGRRAAAARDAALETAARCLGGDGTRATAHHTTAEGTTSGLRAAQLGGGGGVLMSLSDDAQWTAAVAAEVVRAGGEVVWVSDAQQMERVASAAASGKVRAAALQLLSPVTGRCATEALDFLREAELWTVVDASHAVAMGAVDAEDVGDVVICGGEVLGVGGTFASIALWTSKAWELRRAGDVCVDGHVGAAALGALATALQHIDSVRQRNASLLQGVRDALAEGYDAQQLMSAVGEELRYPCVSGSFTMDEAAVAAGRRLRVEDAAGSAGASLRVVRAYSMGRGRRKVGRPATLSAHLHGTQHTADTAFRFTRQLLAALRGE